MNPSPQSLPEAGSTTPESPYDVRALSSGREWFGYLTLENLDAVAVRLRSLIGDGQRFTFVACNEGLGNYRPEVRTSQVARKVEVNRDDDGRSGSIVVVDSYGVWSIHTDAATQREAHQRGEVSFSLAYLHVRRGKVEITHRAPVGSLLYWVAAVEDHSDGDDVLVLKADLVAYLNRGTTGNLNAEVDALNRLLVAAGLEQEASDAG